MSTESQAILERALSLPAIERARILDSLMSSLDQPDPQIDAAWARESEARIRAVDQGTANTYADDEVWAEFDEA